MTDDDPRLSPDTLYDAVEAAASPVVTATTVARHTALPQAAAAEGLAALVDAGDAQPVTPGRDRHAH